MKLNPFAIAAAILGLSTLTSAESLRKVAEANNRAFIHAMKAKDINWFKSTAAPDFYEEGGGGKKTSRSESLAKISQLFAMGNIASFSTKVLTVTPKGNGMIVKTTAHVVMTFQAPNAKKPSKMIGDSTYEEKWTKDNGHWKVHWIKTLKDTGTIDGKPMPADM